MRVWRVGYLGALQVLRNSADAHDVAQAAVLAFLQSGRVAQGLSTADWQRARRMIWGKARWLACSLRRGRKRLEARIERALLAGVLARAEGRLSADEAIDLARALVDVDDDAHQTILLCFLTGVDESFALRDLASVGDAFADLDSELRVVIIASVVLGLTRDETAKAFDWPPGTVASRKKKAESALRAKIGERLPRRQAGDDAAGIEPRVAAPSPREEELVAASDSGPGVSSYPPLECLDDAPSTMGGVFAGANSENGDRRS